MPKKIPQKKEETARINVGENLKRISEIAEWLEAQERSDEPDFDAGLAKVRDAAALIKETRVRLAEIENEFREIAKEAESATGMETEE